MGTLLKMSRTPKGVVVIPKGVVFRPKCLKTTPFGVTTTPHFYSAWPGQYYYVATSMDLAVSNMS